MKRFCSKCGKEAGANTSFCDDCGNPIKSAGVDELAGAAQQLPAALFAETSMKNLIVASLEGLTGVAFFVITIFVALVGYLVGQYLVGRNGLAGSVIGAGIGLVVAVQVTGLIYIQLSINERLREIRELLRSR